MHFTVDHAELTPALTLLSRIVPSRSVRPILSSIFIQAQDGHLTLGATDLETAAVTTVPALIEAEGRAAIPARYISELLRRIPSGTLTWKTDAQGSGVSVTWSRSQFSLHGFSAEEYPPIPAFPEDADRTISQAVLRHAITHSAFAAAQTESARALLTGVELRLAEKALFALATDGFQVAAYASQPEVERPEADGVVVPANTLQELSRMLTDTDQPCDVTRRGNQMLFRAGSTYLVARLLEGKYFAVLDLVPKSFPTTVVVARELLIGACERVGLVSDAEPPHAVVLAVHEGGIELTASSVDVGTAQEDLDCQTSGPTVRMGFNGRQLLEGLRRFAGTEVQLEISGSNTLTRFTDPADRRLQFMQMPLQMPA